VALCKDRGAKAARGLKAAVKLGSKTIRTDALGLLIMMIMLMMTLM
jgi:hypothetical protein